ncbi:F-box/WD repeat-containing protein 5 isoform X2 [Macrosteles quadrilineatus]|uniref:F-box/WD repeat-containing protein 5 isoform X2 n=1 Tax=Macrosteles quadrilineatus TaxID=74068 RepID=UPI0023E33BB3|nr:F-box/WD repeat-containing protein 5 isoform X2 [Macrosteles quadrilineatus]
MEGENGDISCWELMPDPMLMQVFQYLTARELLSAGQTCHHWHRVSHDEMLWKRLLYRDYRIDPSIGILPGKTSWQEEYKRLCYHTPTVCSEVLKEHAHQVLHVSFAHNGTMFATSSKDGFIIVWNSDYPASERYSHDMKNFSWKYTQFSQFNQSDTLLLVSGVHFGTPNSTSGEIAVFSLTDGFQLQCRVVNKPYDIFGTWYSDQHLLSGDLYWLAHLVSTTGLWLNKASQETASEHTPILSQLFRFYNTNASSIRAIMVANCLTSEDPQPEGEGSGSTAGSPPLPTPQERGNPLSHRELNRRSASFRCNTLVEDAPSSDPHSSEGEAQSSSICYNTDYRMFESQWSEQGRDSDSDGSGDEVEVESEVSDMSVEGDDEDLANMPEKYLIFTTGSKTYTPHQIGLKRIKPVSFPPVLPPGASLQERLAERRERRQREREREDAGFPPPPDPDWLDYAAVADRFDTIDHVIDLHGHIIGMGLSPDHRFLYVNSRPWPSGYRIKNPLDPPPIAQEIDIHVIDLVTLKEVGTMLRAHKAYTPNNDCFFIFLDVCDHYVASGAEDKHGYLWDRHYGVCLAKYPHTDVVNSVAFNPRDSNMLVTTSDDYTVKVWRSRARLEGLLGVARTNNLPRAVKGHQRNSRCNMKKCVTL